MLHKLPGGPGWPKAIRLLHNWLHMESKAETFGPRSGNRAWIASAPPAFRGAVWWGVDNEATLDTVVPGMSWGYGRVDGLCPQPTGIAPGQASPGGIFAFLCTSGALP